MFNIDIYTYEDKPGYNDGKVKIFPLNDKGMNKYLLNKQSHVFTYLNQLKQDPSILREYNTIRNGHKTSINFANSNNNNIPLRKSNSISQIVAPIKGDSLSAKKYHNVIPSSIKKRISNSRGASTTKNINNDLCNRLFYSRNPQINENTNSYFAKIKRAIISTRNKEFNNNYLKCENEKYKPIKYHKRNSCWESYLDKDNNSTKSLKKSSSFSLFNNNKGLNNTMNIKEEFLGEKILQEYEALKNKNNEMKDILLKQTNPEFLKRNKLPDLRAIVNGTNIIRNMSVRSDLSFSEIEQPKIKGRNFYGGLFKY
jgi:hypothetical protein